MNIENNEKRILPLCPECGRLPFFNFKGEHISSITIKCECGLNNSYDIKDYLKMNKNNQEKAILTCKIHQIPFFEFCISCQNNLCKKCISSHNNHSKKPIKSEPSFSKKSLSLKNNLQKLLDESLKYMINLKTFFIDRMIEMINHIESKYEEWSTNNKNMHELLQMIIDSYSEEEPNYFIFKNIKSIQLENLLKFEYENSSIITEDNYNKLINFFDSSIIFEQVNKTLYPKDFTEEKRIENAHKSSIRSLIFLTDGRLASSSSDLTIKIYNKHTYECELTLIGHKETVWSLCSLDNNRIVSSSSDEQIKIWKIEDKTYTCEHTISKAHQDEILSVISLSNNRIASCGSDGNINIWSLKDYKLLAQLNVNREKKPIIKSIAQLKKKEILISGAYDAPLCIWNINTYKLIRQICDVICAWSNSLLQIDDNRIIVGGKSKLSVINISSYTIEYNIQGSFIGDIFSLLKLRNGNILFGCGSRSLFVYSFHTKKSYEIPNSHKYSINCILNLNSSNFATCSGDQSIIIWKY